MVSLIVVFLTIAFLAALAVTAINYTPWWVGRAHIAHELAERGFPKLERAYELRSTINNAPPVPDTGVSDGGLNMLMQPQFGYLPRAPRGMSWSYGHQSAAGQFEGTDYICLSGNSVDFGEYKGVERLASAMGTGQAILATDCGATSPATPGGFPAKVAFTYYVQWVPGVQ
jgi:hypothetical protein